MEAAHISETAEPALPQKPRWTPYQVRVGDLNLRVARTEGGTGTPLLLITGIGAHMDMWAPLERCLSGRDIIAFDSPGTGESDRLKRPLRMDGFARIVRDLLDELGQDVVDVLGVSWGGALAQELAHRHPERIRRLILCATSTGTICVPPRPLPALFLVTPARYYHPALFTFMLPRIVGGKTARDRDVLAAQCGPRLSKPPDAIGYLHQMYATAGWTSIHWLHQIPHRTLVIAGEDDRAIPLANGKILAARIPDARLHVVKDGGHVFVLDEPESIAGAVHSFLDEE